MIKTKIVKLKYPGILILKQTTRQLENMRIGSGMYLKIEVSDKPLEQKKPDQKHEKKQEPQRAKIPGYVWILIVIAIIFASLYLGNIGKNEPIQEVPKLLRNYELPISH